jgi:hypothetical protein
MIVRVFEGVVTSPNEGDFVRFLRDEAIPELREAPGLVYAKVGRQVLPEGIRILVVTEWRTPAALYAWVGPDLQFPRIVAPHLDWLAHYTINHYEALDAGSLLEADHPGEAGAVAAERANAPGPPGAAPPDDASPG